MKLTPKYFAIAAAVMVFAFIPQWYGRGAIFVLTLGLLAYALHTKGDVSAKITTRGGVSLSIEARDKRPPQDDSQPAERERE